MRHGILMAILLICACGSGKAPNASSVDGGADGGNGGDGGPTGPVATSCASVADARCTLLQMCDPGTLQSTYGTLADCEARESLDCAQSLAAPGTGASPTTVSACASSLTSEACADFTAGTIPANCMPPVGTLANGKGCLFDGQCTSQFCTIAAGAACGTCGTAPTAGQPCGDSGCATGSGLVCQAGPMGATCQTTAGVGAACVDAAAGAGMGMMAAGMECGAGLTCVGYKPPAMHGAMPTPGKCDASGAAGAVCDPTHATAPGCDARAGLVCAAATKTCVMATYASAGMACGVVNGADVACGGGSTCQLGGAGHTEGICQAPAADGDACQTGTTGACIAPARCVLPAGGTGTVGTCTVPDASQCM